MPWLVCVCVVAYVGVGAASPHTADLRGDRDRPRNSRHHRRAQPTAVNSSGVVVGYTWILSDSAPYPAAFAYSGGTIQDLGQGAGPRYGIDGPLVVGRNNDEQAFLETWPRA